jgi:aryl-alcohol dehydrogenase-like predicted oxidoreductase
MRAVEVVRGIGAKRGATPAQIALAWILHKGEDIVPIPGTKRRKYLEENLAAAEIELNAEEMRVLDEVLAPGKVAGPRYGQERMAMIDR